MSAIYTYQVRLTLGVDYASIKWPMFQSDGLTPLNLTGYAARLQFWETGGKTDSPRLLLTEKTGVSIGGVYGTLSFSIPQLAINQFADVAGRWELLVDSAATPAVTTKVVEGPWSLSL